MRARTVNRSTYPENLQLRVEAFGAGHLPFLAFAFGFVVERVPLRTSARVDRYGPVLRECTLLPREAYRRGQDSC